MASSDSQQRNGSDSKNSTKVGYLHKMERGSLELLKGRERKFKRRYCTLTKTSFTYKKKGAGNSKSFPVQRIKFVENADLDRSQGTTLDFSLCFQFGDKEKVMHFIASNSAEKDEWMEALKRVAVSSGHRMMTHYHPGLYIRGFSHTEWSCCKGAKKSQGCTHTNWMACESTTSTETEGDHDINSSESSHTCQRKTSSASMSINSTESIGESVTSSSSCKSVGQDLEEKTDEIALAPMLKSCDTTSKSESFANRRRWDYAKHKTELCPVQYSVDSGFGTDESRQGSFDILESTDTEKDQPKTLAIREECFTQILTLHHSIKISSCSSLVSDCKQLIAGTNEGMVWYITPDCTEIKSCTKVAGPVASLSAWSDYKLKGSDYVAVGSAVVQVIKTSDEQPTRVMYRKAKDRLMVPGRKHLVSFIGDLGKIATTEVGGNSIDIWPPPADKNFVMEPEITIPINGKVLSLCASRESENLLLAVLLEKDHTKPKLNVIDVNNDCNQHLLLLEGDSTDVFAVLYSNGTKIAAGASNHLQVHSFTTAEGLCSTVSKEFDSDISCVNVLHDNLLGVGFNTGNFICIDDNLTSTLYNCDIIDSQQSNSPVVSIARIGNKDVCVAHSDGVLQLWKFDHDFNGGEKIRQRSTLGMELHNQGIFSMPEIVDSSTDEQEIAPGVYLTLPQEVIDDNIQVEKAFRPCGFGHATFVLPEGMVPISQAVWLCATPEKAFKEPATLKLFHCLQNDTEERTKRIKFLKADHKDITRCKNGELMIEFKATDEGQSEFPINTPYGILQDHHFCAYCLAVYCEEREVLKIRNFCLSILKPIAYSRQKTAKIYCILSFDLPDCKKLIGEQLARISGRTVDYSPVIVKPLQFDTPMNQSVLEMHVDCNQARRQGWRIHFESERKIYAEDVNFFKYQDIGPLVNACTKSEMDKPYPYTYPPRFVVEVSPEYAQNHSEITLRFTGARRELTTEIRLDILREERDLQQYRLGGEDGGRPLGGPLRHFNGVVGPT